MPRTVLLINPPIYDFAAYDLFNKPLGLLYLASFLRQTGYNVRLIDTLDRRHRTLTGLHSAYKAQKTKPNGTGKYHSSIVDRPECLSHIPRHYRRHGLPTGQFTSELISEFTDHRPLAVLVTSMMTYWYPGVAEAIDLIRQAMPATPVALGGVYATLMPRHAQSTCRPDKLFTGPALLPVLQWLNAVEGTGCKNGISEDHQHDNVTDEFMTWPAPAHDLYDQLDYLVLISSLGCPFRCDYCASGILQPRMQRLKPEAVVEQISSGAKLVTPHEGCYNIAFMDDALLADSDRHIIPILRQLADLDLPLRFHCPNGLHPRFITTEVAELLAANRFTMIRLSFEASSSHSTGQLTSDNKINDVIFADAVRKLEAAGFDRSQLETYILTGLPGQTITELQHSAAAVHELGLQIRICQYSPIPGTKLFQQACQLYNIDPNEPLLHNNTALPIVGPQLDYAAFRDFKTCIDQMNQKLQNP